MKTPTNFIPIIGPLYADDLQINKTLVIKTIIPPSELPELMTTIM